MHRIFLLAILCMACHSNDNQSRPGREQPAAGYYLSFLKEKVNPLLQNLETTAAKRKLDSIWPFIQQRDNYVDRCSWLRCMAVVYQHENKPDSARFYIDQALQLAIAKDTTERQILAGKIQTAAVLSDCKSLDSALRYALDAYAIAKKIDTPGIPFICLKLYDIYEKIGDLEMQKKYLFEGFRRSTSPKHKTVFATNISAYYDRINEVDSALLFFQALMKDSSFSNSYYDAVRYENLGALLSKKGNYKEGLNYQLKGMQISRSLDELNGQSYCNLAATYRQLGQYKQDEKLLDTALWFASGEKNWALKKKIWGDKANNLRLQNKLLQALNAKDSAAAYFQKEVDSSIAGQARELEAKYSLLEKDNQIKSLALSNQESERIRERQRSTIVRIICAAALLGLFVFWLWRQKQIKRNIRENSLRQQLLRGQIESHFLLSSVNRLKELIQDRKIEGVTEFVQRLGLLFRLSLENSMQPFVQLKNELDALDSYLTLQQAMLVDKFDYYIEVEDTIEPEVIMIPPMLLQPFAENSILHGFKDLTKKGQIHISIQRNQTTLCCVIEDNGLGLRPGAVHSEKQSLSTLINKERLKILSRQTGTMAQLNITNKKATTGKSGVRVELIIPYTRKPASLAGRKRIDG